MSKTTYIKGKDGKFQGSIGAGKTDVPSAAPAITTSPTPKAEANRVHEPFSVEDLPDYLYAATNDRLDRIQPHPLPEGIADESDLDIDNRLQDALDYDISTLLWEANNVLVEDGSVLDRVISDSYEEEEADTTDPNQDYTPGVGLVETYDDFPSDQRLLDLASSARRRANNLRARGHVHQAYAYEHAAETIEYLYDLAQTRTNYENSLDAEHWVSAHGAKPSGPTDTGLENGFSVAERRHFQRHCISYCERAFDHTAMEEDSQTLRRNAIIRDYLPLSGGDPEAAAVMIALLDRS